MAKEFWMTGDTRHPHDKAVYMSNVEYSSAFAIILLWLITLLPMKVRKSQVLLNY